MMPSLEITIPLPPRETHPNARCHWRTKANAIKQQREDAFLAAKAALGEANINPPRWKAATILATFYKPSNRAQLADQDGLNSSLKSAADGIEDAGILANDRGLTWLPPVQFLGAAAGRQPKVVLLITALEDSTSRPPLE